MTILDKVGNKYMRFLPLTAQDRADMLQAVGVPSVKDLYAAVPQESLLKRPIDLPPHMGELEIERELAGLASKNRAANAGPFFLGAGCYYHHIPATVDAMIQRGEFLTAYTPYQPEISQGRSAVLTALSRRIIPTPSWTRCRLSRSTAPHG